ncbi:hypothetical protein [Microcoleus sp. CAWBG640]|uniref:hypothetical protein n=1 Tax=Microcoleus sp. CAWBG640 TaxID=2841653 RepID=UPI00312BAD32
MNVPNFVLTGGDGTTGVGLDWDGVEVGGVTGVGGGFGGVVITARYKRYKFL